MADALVTTHNSGGSALLTESVYRALLDANAAVDLAMPVALERDVRAKLPDTFKPTKAMAANAKKGLALRDKFERGGTEVGVKRAEQLADQDELSAADVKAIHSYFARHAVDKDAKGHEWGSDEDPSAGYIAWLLWGGEGLPITGEPHGVLRNAREWASVRGLDLRVQLDGVDWDPDLGSLVL